MHGWGSFSAGPISPPKTKPSEFFDQNLRFILTCIGTFCYIVHRTHQGEWMKRRRCCLVTVRWEFVRGAWVACFAAQKAIPLASERRPSCVDHRKPS